MPIDPHSDRPHFQQIADDLRRAIRAGDYPPGAQLPTESTLIHEYAVGRLTARRALSVLAGEGLTTSIRGRGVFVREQRPVLTVRNTRFRRSDRTAGKGALAAEAERAGLTWESEDLGLSVIDTPDNVRQWITEDQVAVKRRRMIVGGVPTQLADSYVPYSIDQETGYSQGANAPGGIYELLETHGHRLTRFREELRARAATPEEAIALDLPAGSPVVLLGRVAFDHHEHVVEYFDSVCAADQHTYVYEFDHPED